MSADSGELTFEQAKAMASNPDPVVRAQLAARGDVRPELLYFLADDPDPDVRRAIAGNAATPLQADLVLSRDREDDVRESLSRKIARLAPGLDDATQHRVHLLTLEILGTLARDQAVAVRAVMSEALKDVVHAPNDLIKRLARDSELVVATPVLEHSPVLTDEDLIAIIEDQPGTERLSAISRRRNVSAPVSDAVVDSRDRKAVAVLLGNDSAQIREETLDRLIDEAEDVEIWHEPLVRRPKLSARAVARLTRFVAANLISTLQERHDLDPQAARAVAAAVESRLGAKTGRAWGDEPKPAKSPPDPAEARVRKLKEAGRLNERVVLDHLQGGDRHFAAAALAVMTRVPLPVVEKLLAAHLAEPVVSLVWYAGLSPAFAVQAQMRLAGIPAREALYPDRHGHFPLSHEVMAARLKPFGIEVPTEGLASS